MKTNKPFSVILLAAALAALTACTSPAPIALVMPPGFAGYDTLHLYIQYIGTTDGDGSTAQRLATTHGTARRTDGIWQIDPATDLTPPRGTTLVTVSAIYTGRATAGEPVYHHPLMQSITSHPLAEGNDITLNPLTGPCARITFTGLAPGDVVSLPSHRLRAWQFRADHQGIEPAPDSIPALTAGRDSTVVLYAQIFGKASEDIAYTIARTDGTTAHGHFSPGPANTNGSGFAGREYTVGGGKP